MKKIIFYSVILLVSVIAFSFKAPKTNNEITITVTATKQTKFDMNQDGTLTKDLLTPYKMTINTNDSRFIFKSATSESGFKIDVTDQNGSLTADWSVTVLLISPKGLSTFGID